MLQKIEAFTDRFSNALGYVAAALMLVMMLNVFYDTMARYFFDTGSIAMQELEWHFFSIVFLFGIGYGLKEDSHVRVDVFYDRMPEKAKAVINIGGTFLFLLPLAWLVAEGSIGFVQEAYQTGEVSGDPGGLTQRWLIKMAIPVSFVFLCVSALGFVVRNIQIFRGLERAKTHDINEDIL